MPFYFTQGQFINFVWAENICVKLSLRWEGGREGGWKGGGEGVWGGG
jgi:hypothetical protein